MPVLSLLLAVSSAHAADCAAMVAKVDTLPPEAVAAAFGDLVGCDKKVAEASFMKYLVKATDSDALVALVMRAVDADVWNPVWTSLSKIPSYDARDEVAQRVGEACGEHPKVVNFLQGAYFGLRDVEFQQWDDAYGACADEKLWTWAEGQVKSPPPKQFDEKYNYLVSIYVKHKKIDALGPLVEGVVKAAGNNGPFDAMLAQMSEAIVPALGASVNPDDQARLVEALSKVAQQVDIERARSVANQLANSGAEGAAARLLPVLYPDRTQPGGTFLYGAAGVEAGMCDGKKVAVLHYASVTEPGKRWSILGDLEGPMRGMKARLKDCTLESPWPVFHSPEPVKTTADVDAWAEARVKEWAANGYDVKAQKEKAFALP